MINKLRASHKLEIVASTTAQLRWNHTGSTVSFGKLRWYFTRAKAKVILCLLQADAEFPEMDGKLLRDLSGVKSSIRQLFHRDPAWKTLIIPLWPVRPGHYRRADTGELQLLLKQHGK